MEYKSLVKQYYQYKDIIKVAKKQLLAIRMSGLSLGNIHRASCLLRQIKECNEACRKLKAQFNADWLREHRSEQVTTSDDQINLILTKEGATEIYRKLGDALMMWPYRKSSKLTLSVYGKKDETSGLFYVGK